MNFRNILPIIFLTALFILSPNPVYGDVSPVITLQPDFSEVAPESYVELKVSVSSEKELNAFDIDIEYSPELFAFERAYTKNSFVSLWKSMPLVPESGRISLIGGTTKPWSGSDGEIVTLIFKARRAGTSAFAIREAQFALADGKGTKVDSSGLSQKIAVSFDSEIVDSKIPLTPPRVAAASIINDPETDNPIVVLNSPDAGSIKWLGMRSRNWLFWSDWQKIQMVSPIPKSAWTAQVKALGYNGEEHTINFYLWQKVAVKAVIVVLILLFLFITMRVFGKRKNNLNNSKEALMILFLSLAFFSLASSVEATNLSLSPSTGTFSIGSTFDVKIFLDTEGKDVNALDLKLNFPSDILQVVSPSAGQSIVGVWTSTPRFDNQSGEVILQGGMPGGINVSRGLVSTITFRVRQTGQAILKISGDSKVLLNDGKGTDDLQNIQSAVLKFILPPPAGPSVASETHPDQTEWYANSYLVLNWSNSLPISGYSFALNDTPVFNLDNIINSKEHSVSYKDLSSGRYYFHIKGLSRDGVWGGTTHFAVNVDARPPAEFPVEIKPATRTTSKSVFLYFDTTDAHSGIERYELAAIPLSSVISTKEASAEEESFFVEATSPDVLDLDIGKYDVVVQAYDKAGNFTESVRHVRVMTPFTLIATSKWTIGFLLVLIGVLAFVFLRIRKWHDDLGQRHTDKKLPDNVKKQIEELKSYKKKYGHLVLLIGILSSFFLFSHITSAQEKDLDLSPPLISTISREISNNDIFYIGGKTNDSEVQIIIYMQDLETGETQNFTINPDNKGNWLYRHSTFLPSGEYVLWTQSSSNELLSPPSPQERINVSKTAIQFGSSRFSFETLYFILTILLLITLVVLIGLIIFFWRRGKSRHKSLVRELKEAEDSVKRGFAILRRDIEAELASVRKAASGGNLSEEEKQREEHLLKDLAEIEQKVGKEVWDIEKYT